jgi:hypothetical protein
MIKLLKLSEEAFEYIRNELSQGGYLPQRLLELDLEQGVVHTYVPVGFTPNSSIDYGESLNYLTGVRPLREIRRTIVDLISDYLDDSESKYAIFETWQEKGDPSVLKHDLQYFFIHSRLYGFLRGSDELKPIMEHLREAGPYPTIITLVKMPECGSPFLPATELSEDAYSKIVENVDCLIIGAWDGEGYIIWRKN